MASERTDVFGRPVDDYAVVDEYRECIAAGVEHAAAVASTARGFDLIEETVEEILREAEEDQR